MDLFESSIHDGNLEFGEVETEASDEDLNEVADHDLALNPVSHVDGSDGTIIEDSHDEDIVKNDVLVGEPYLGMEFDSVDAAKIHYKTYALSLGFSICLGTKYNAKRKGGMVTGRTFMCSKGTIRPIRRYGRGVSNDNIMRSNMTPNVVVHTTRPHCKAHLRVRMKEGGKWIVTGFVKEHNHELQVNNENPLSPVPERLVKTDFVHEVSAQQPQIVSHVTPRSSGSRNTSFTDSKKEVTAIKERIAKDRGMQQTTTSTSQVTTNASEDFTTLDPTKMSTEGRKRTVRPSSLPDPQQTEVVSEAENMLS
ncbi:Protein FAR1-RELATED SEQUENCE 5 [Acorus calamus]|uniref:Protein FAR1-RELATED SEQUENCE 5 n=1 Tax=Acorus calamus TaxID=4465 RepID=A0AAV9C9G8_ACOCL|nr:Protein FAR1-RELATED SEQUENCE 5 [Acorus calamus]